MLSKKKFKKAFKNAHPQALLELKTKKWNYKKSLKNAVYNKDAIAIFVFSGSIVECIINKKIGYKKTDDIPFNFRLMAFNKSENHLTSYQCKQFSKIYSDYRNPGAHGGRPPADYTDAQLSLCLEVVYTLVKVDTSSVLKNVKNIARTEWLRKINDGKKNQRAN